MTFSIFFGNLSLEFAAGMSMLDWYQSYSGDCTNYVSQALYAGIWKAPTDQSGMSAGRNWNDDWYYNFNHPKGIPNGEYSEPWAVVQEQRNFLTTNYTGLGPYGYETPMLCSVSVGDIVQLKGVNTSGVWDHEGIIVWKSPTESCSSLSSYWVNAHTIDRYHYPLSNWSTYPMRYIIITGYRLDTTGTQSFSDVPKNQWYWQDVERLYAAGFTGGCATNPLRYCPTNSVTRAQMAVFLLRGIHGPNYMPPPATGTIFSDVTDPNWFFSAWIEQLYNEGITGGCATNPLRYCPDNSVTHAQMAIFLLRSKYGASYTPPPVGYSYFADVNPSDGAAAWIFWQTFEGFSYGAYNCSPGNYCPGQAITRAEMASMLVRTFINLP